jgi:hypothetical protein
VIHRIYRDRRTPWEYLKVLTMTDRDPAQDEEWMTERLQRKWPGNYRVEKLISYEWQYVEYRIVFDNPAEETLFRIKWA